ncbi:MFS transporter [Streptomyces sp. NPDC090499]|uniref:MFS transporter n=1 Tax=Streptomyces sp. NPDC090499 TaxID=3365965 RepID=UPI0038144195
MGTSTGNAPLQKRPSAAASGPHENVIVLALGLASMLVSMMQTLVVPILGLIQSSLHTTAAGASWVTTVTLLSAAVFTPLLGRFGDQHGKKSTLVAVMAVLIAGTLLAATTHSLAWLITARALQGSATAIFPLALSVLRDEIRPERLHAAMAMVSGAFAFGSGIALVAAGLMTAGSHPDYRNVFWLVTGLSAVTLVAVVVLVPATRHTARGRTDIPGTVTLAATLVLLLLPVTQGHEWGWSSARTVGCFIGAVVAAGAWMLIELKVPQPLVDMRMFAHRPVLLSNLVGLLVGFGMFALFVGVSALAQVPPQIAGYGFGASVLRASVEYLLPVSVIALLLAPAGGRLVTRYGPRAVLLTGSLLGTAGFVWIAVDHRHTVSVVGGSVLMGAAGSLGYAAMPAITIASVPRHQTGIANGINSIARSAGGAVGSAVITTVLASKSLPKAPVLPAESQFTLSFVLGAVGLALIAPTAWFGLRRIGLAPHHTGESAPIPDTATEPEPTPAGPHRIN